MRSFLFLLAVAFAVVIVAPGVAAIDQGAAPAAIEMVSFPRLVFSSRAFTTTARTSTSGTGMAWESGWLETDQERETR